jgi:hypothetical protein
MMICEHGSFAFDSNFVAQLETVLIHLINFIEDRTNDFVYLVDQVRQRSWVALPHHLHAQLM